MKYFFLLQIFVTCLPHLTSGQTVGHSARTEDAEFIHRAIKRITDIMVHDIYSPPVASRTYAYITIAGYEAAVASDKDYRSFAGQLHGLGPCPVSKNRYNAAVAAVQAILTVGRAMVISEQQVDTFYRSLMSEFRKTGIAADVYSNSIAVGSKIANHVLAWAANDQYKQTRTFVKYTVLNDSASWKPTPPAYMKAIEPNWNKMRTFVIDSASQFKPAPPPPFSTEKQSQFYNDAKAVYDAGSNLTEEQKEIANFWDCNPFKMNVNGHVMYASKKISPGGHWINITRLVCRKAGIDTKKSLEAYACLAITVADAFISCWDEKYRSIVIRPETYINQYIDGNWIPVLQTPPFPEYTSGHSVISSCAAVVLTQLLGDNFSFSDSTEIEFGLPARHFTSFSQAAEEAAISRFYGGIHYMPAIKIGLDVGKTIGTFVSAKLNTSVKN
ncbi:MAG TPA: vanadium-dependent haloperoxidase [Flavitalea sp.]|nr:vanadium-dependent haloperoxidase [Flavitalea sp.]